MHVFDQLKVKMLWLLLLPIAAMFCSCRPQPVGPGGENPATFANGVYILNEGLFQQNNSTLSFYDFKNNELSDDVFRLANHRGLGDVGNDLQKYGSKLYCVINNSNIVEVVDANTVISQKTISLPGKQPRYIAFYNDKAYVSCFDGDVVRIDTASLEVEATLHTGPNPDGLCVCNGKLYVANSGGLTSTFGNTVSVIDIPSFTVSKEITVTVNPTRIKSYNNSYVYVVSNGNYGNIPYTLQKIDCNSDELVKTYDIEALNLDIYQNKAYIYSYNFSTQASWIKVMNLDTDEIEEEQFIKDGTKIKTPYCIKVNPLNGDVWITDAGNFTVNGDVYCFDKDGKKKFSFEAGLNPSSIVLN